MGQAFISEPTALSSGRKFRPATDDIDRSLAPDQAHDPDCTNVIG
jgi:hypothetical protein